MKERVGVPNWPLYWPAGWERTKAPTYARFRNTTVYGASQKVLRELYRLGATNVVISTNLKVKADGVPYSGQRIPEDTGAAVWFWLHDERGELRERVLACDRWNRVEYNLHAIALHVEALRAQERWGVGTTAQAFGGYTALPDRAESSVRAWETLGIPREGATTEAVNQAFKRAARTAHPDVGGSREAWDQLQAAKEAALLELGA